MSLSIQGQESKTLEDAARQGQGIAPKNWWDPIKAQDAFFFEDGDLFLALERSFNAIMILNSPEARL